MSVGDSPCIITARSSGSVTCTTTGHAPATLPVMVTTTQGVARTVMEGSGQSLTTMDSSGQAVIGSSGAPMEGRGEETLSRATPFVFSYELEVNSIGPLQSSVRGGLLLTIEGRGFHPARTSVLIGGSPATVTAANDTVVQCLTPPPIAAYTITFEDDGYSVGRFASY